MGHLVGAVMVVTLVGSTVQVVRGHGPRGLDLVSLALCGGPVLLAALRVVPNAVRLGMRADTVSEQSALARSICREHLLCLAGMLGFLVLQLSAAAR